MSKLSFGCGTRHKFDRRPQRYVAVFFVARFPNTLFFKALRRLLLFTSRHYCARLRPDYRLYGQSKRPPFSGQKVPEEGGIVSM